MDARQQAEGEECVTTHSAGEAAETANEPDIRFRYTASGQERPVCDSKQVPNQIELIWLRLARASTRTVFEVALKWGFYRGIQETTRKARQIRGHAHPWDFGEH
jgi:hypothetical protein